MFNSIWRRLTQWQARITTPVRRPSRTRLRIEVLEDRVTPTNITATISNTTLTITKISGNASPHHRQAPASSRNSPSPMPWAIRSTASAPTRPLRPSPPWSSSSAPAPTASPSTASPTVRSTSRDLTTSTGLQTTAGIALNITGSGSKTIAAQDLFLLNNTNFTMASSPATAPKTPPSPTSISPAPPPSPIPASAIPSSRSIPAPPTSFRLEQAGSLSITNGTGADQNFISDTHFTGSVTINNDARRRDHQSIRRQPKPVLRRSATPTR